ncbi:hypothetical protein HNY73_000415 [Argiope bruennichi]|uniref:Uncharacterized protein n=1 Tax=Argiope bruennichi TaxID=94029 RepID=A0A8T0FY64_ARGBR|nr:hypothetical protein HNY73_000415 [Argiope bruennichi]
MGVYPYEPQLTRLGRGWRSKEGKEEGRDSWHVDLKAIFYGVSGSRGCGCYGNPSLTIPTIFLLHQMRWKAENNDIGGAVYVIPRQFQVSAAIDETMALL